MSPAFLAIRDLSKSFEGVAATDRLSLEVARGEVHAIIGPNGAGKTTLLAQLAGELLPDSGEVIFKGRDITRLAAHRRARLGIARSFQITSLMMDLPAIDNVALAVQCQAGHGFRFWRPARLEAALVEPAALLLERVGLAERSDTMVRELSHGERRRLEIAVALATDPELLLLDEPMAGMGAEESIQMIQTLRELKGAKTMLLIEHDMDVVFQLADRITVLVYGRAIASGPPAAIRGNEAVRRAYLGDEVA